MHVFNPAERLVVAADFDPTNALWPFGRNWVRLQVLTLADSLSGTGVYLKVNSALRTCGYGLIHEIRQRGLRVFADLKLNDISETMALDGMFLSEARPDIVTAMCTSGSAGLRALKVSLFNAEVLGVTALTSLHDADTQAMFACSPLEATLRFASIAEQALLDGLVSSPKEVAMLRAQFGDFFTLSTPAIRPAWAMVHGDDQNPHRAMTPFEAIKAGADRIVVGRPITQAADPREAVMRTIDEIRQAAM